MTTSSNATDIIKVQARVESYRNKNAAGRGQGSAALTLWKSIWRTFFPAYDCRGCVRTNFLRPAFVRTRGECGGNPWLNRLVTSVIEDPAIVPRLKRAPAAKIMHHAFLGGLLEHMVSLCDLCRVVAGHYPELDPDLLLTGAILHDIGKLDELCYERAIHYTDEGQLLGHIILEVEQVGRKMDQIEGFPADLKTLVKHLLISHHGQYEFGSPKLPMFREALVLHYLDDLDSKMGAARAILNAPGGEGAWTAYSGALNRRMLRLDQFRTSPSVPSSFNLGDLTKYSQDPSSEEPPPPAGPQDNGIKGR